MIGVNLETFSELYTRLLVLLFQQHVGLAKPEETFDRADARSLIQWASALALDPPSEDGSDPRFKAWAYDVATRLALHMGDFRYVKAAEMILARLGNFPGQNYLKEVFPDLGTAGGLPIALALEALAHEADNTLSFTGLGERTLTDFQKKLILQLRSMRSVSVSAPTSAGKSYALALDIIDSVASRKAKVVAYLVPTRALIRQVMNDLVKLLYEAGLANVAVSSAPVIVEQEQISDGIIYVLTQERLMSLLYSPEGSIQIDRLYVDEAQEIGDDERGMILHSAVQATLRKCPSAQVCFASPLTSNPALLFGEFSLGVGGHSFIERFSPVSQVIIALDEVKGNANAIEMSVMTPKGSRRVGQVSTPFKFRGVKERLANTAAFFTRTGESTIIYANGASEAMEIALNLAGIIEAESAIDQEVKDLQEFVRLQVHSSYALVDTLGKGVAFHYGRMPHLIRGQIEELLKKRKLKYVVCTSTLLQGINLPAKNIVIMSPRKGPGTPMTSSDFWNLAGRAGRLRETFSGTIWCINPSVWEGKPLDGPRLSEISSSFRESLADQAIGEAVIAVIDDRTLLSAVVDKERVEQVLAKIFTEFTCENIPVANSVFADISDKERLDTIDAKCQDVRMRIQVPVDVCKRNSTISPLNIDELWLRFSRANDIAALIPLDPIQNGALERMRIIFQIIDEVFLGVYNNSYRYFAPLAYWWVRGNTLRELIKSHLEYNKTPNDRAKINAAITKLLDNLEQTVRFRYVKYLKAYADTLLSFLDKCGRAALKSRVVPLHLYVEFGARDKVLLMLMSLGVSRTTAIFIRNVITREPEIDRRTCWQKLRNLPVHVLDIPAVCKAEILQMRGKI